MPRAGIRMRGWCVWWSVGSVGSVGSLGSVGSVVVCLLPPTLTPPSPPYLYPPPPPPTSPTRLHHPPPPPTSTTHLQHPPPAPTSSMQKGLVYCTTLWRAIAAPTSFATRRSSDGHGAGLPSAARSSNAIADARTPARLESFSRYSTSGRPGQYQTTTYFPRDPILIEPSIRWGVKARTSRAGPRIGGHSPPRR
jgi:hypothetical protein